MFIYITAIGILMLLFVILFYIGNPSIFNNKPPIGQLFFGLFGTVGIPAFIYYSAQKSYQSPEQRLQEEIEYQFENENVKMIGDSFISSFDLNKVYKILETKNWFLIYQSKQIVNPIPKHNLTNNQLNDLRIFFRSLKNTRVKLK